MKNIIKDETYWLEIWEGYLKGDEAAFSEIYEEYIDSLFAYGCKLTKDREIVKDCIQDIFMNLQRLHPQLHHPKFIEFYLYKSLKNLIFHWIQRERKCKSHSVEEMTVFSLKFNVELDDFDSEYNELQIQKLKEILKTLNSQKRELLFLKFNTGLSYIEIGDLLGMNPDTVKKQVYRTLDFLRKKFGSRLIELFTIFSTKR